MSFFALVMRSLAARKTSTVLTALGAALGVALVAAVTVLGREVETSYRNSGSGFPMILGPKGSPMQLVLNTVYHLDKSPGLMPFRAYEEMRDARWVRLAVPYAVGDSFRGFRVVGTTDAIFNERFTPLPKQPLKLASGRAFKHDPNFFAHIVDDLRKKAAATSRPSGAKDDGHDHHHHHDDMPAEAVVGATVAKELGLSIGAKIEPTHGVEGGKDHKHEHLWTLTGILAPTGTAIDRLVFINIESFFAIDEHQGGAILPESGDVGVSAVIVYPVAATQRAIMMPRLNKRSDIQAVSPSETIRNLLDIVGNVDKVLLLEAALAVVVAILGTAVAIYNLMNERLREIAILRAVGARRGQVLGLVVGESVVVALMGTAVGLLLGRLLIFGIADHVAKTAGFVPDAFAPVMISLGDTLPGLPFEVVAVLAVAVVAALAGLLPAVKAYRTQVARHLSPPT